MNRSATVNTHRYETMVLQNVSDIIVIIDLHFRIQSWNHVAEQFYGIPAANAIGKRIKDLVFFRFHDSTFRKSLYQLQANKLWQGEVSFTNPQGETCFFLQTVKYIYDQHGNEAAILAVGRNITERKKVQEQLARSEQFYRALTANSLDLILLINADGEINFTTPSVKRILGFEPEEILQTNAFQYIHPEDRPLAMKSFQREVVDSPEVKFILVRLLQKSGHWLWCMVRGHNLLNNPAINAVAVYIHDDTPRKKASEALIASEEQFRTLIKDLPIGVIVQDADGNTVITNHSACKIFGITEEEILTNKISALFVDIIHEDNRPFLPAERPTFKAIQRRETVKDLVMGIWHKGKKEYVWIMINSETIVNKEGKLTHIVSSFADITERKKQERRSLAEKIAHQMQLTQATIDGQEAERLEIGKELHDNIGQQLTTIKLFLDLARTTADEKTIEMVDMATKGVSDIINEVRAISRTLVPPTLRDLGFIDSVNDLIDSLRSAQPLQIELDYFEFDEDLLPENKKLTLFRIIQEQVNNILKYAEARHVYIVLRCLPAQVLLQIKDDGKGFDITTVRKGLGIINITNRAEILGGMATIDSSPGNGCTLDVCIPHTIMPVVVE